MFSNFETFMETSSNLNVCENGVCEQQLRIKSIFITNTEK